MNTLQLAQIVAGATRHRDIATMPADDALVLMQCINEGLMEWHRLAPGWMKRATPLGFNLPAPASIVLSCTADSATIAFVTALPSGGFASDEALVGCSFVYGGYRYRLTSTTTLDFPWNGATGNVTFTVYADSIQLNDTLAQIDGIVLLASGEERRLHPISEEEAAYLNETQRTGEPEYYCGIPASSLGVEPGAADSTAGFWEDGDYLYTPTGGKIPIIRP